MNAIEAEEEAAAISRTEALSTKMLMKTRLIL